ncbi:helix-turn-helix domain-containing protein [Clostridium tyrobutyricum]|uniref:helix-turn-helix domain-containing protein n=1 Tax=Clostridium tyrobutyricum TaxID=1519 RepID=UPI001C3950D1|nr:helix-turn-helix transcriptional regulator [Clostridium tyrobutyricum]MBV4429475.1 helix-turn-helix domain-containing protein [Clostridium tyrobutyricum]MBV4444696.1 helix-turn-helix domain-containing protein [Clostridium tyrobutyricum]
MEFGDILKQLREENGLSREDLANALSITYSALSKYETNVRFPDKETLKNIATYFKVSLDYLLGRTNIRTSADKISESVNNDPELTEFWDTLKDREDLKLLFKQTKEMTPGDIKKIIRIIKAIEDEEDRNDG